MWCFDVNVALNSRVRILNLPSSSLKFSRRAASANKRAEGRQHQNSILWQVLPGTCQKKRDTNLTEKAVFILCMGWMLKSLLCTVSEGITCVSSSCVIQMITTVCPRIKTTLTASARWQPGTLWDPLEIINGPLVERLWHFQSWCSESSSPNADW